MNDQNGAEPEKLLLKNIYRRLSFLIALVVVNSLFAGYWFFWSDNELHEYNIFTIFLDVGYWIFMLPSIVAICFSRFRWYLFFLSVLLYIIAVWIGYGHL
ncbi:MAG: hypothetical protein IKD10_03675 [Lentisphaeria bacterium]|nr:hypothetical protein [Lentisphaeria bacterium]